MSDMLNTGHLFGLNADGSYVPARYWFYGDHKRTIDVYEVTEGGTKLYLLPGIDRGHWSL